MVASTLPQVDKLILNLSGSDLAEITWSWDNVIPGFKDTLREQNITLPKLKKAWLPLSPYHNLKKVTVNNILIYLSAQDELIPFNSQQELLQSLQKKRIYIEAIINERHGHMVSGAINLLRFPVYINFLRRK